MQCAWKAWQQSGSNRRISSGSNVDKQTAQSPLDISGEEDGLCLMEEKEKRGSESETEDSKSSGETRWLLLLERRLEDKVVIVVAVAVVLEGERWRRERRLKIRMRKQRETETNRVTERIKMMIKMLEFRFRKGDLVPPLVSLASTVLFRGINEYGGADIL